MKHSRGADSGHRLFHAMVLMGGSLALGCGGIASETREAGDSSGAGGNAGTGGSGVAGAQGGSTAGSAGSGGSNSGSGGSGASECPPAQWDCSAAPPVCAGFAYALPSDCACDTSRPLAPDDCQPGESLVCLMAEAGHPDSDQVAFSCLCLPQRESCELACDEVSMPGASCSEEVSESGTSVLCGCAVIVLR